MTKPRVLFYDIETSLQLAAIFSLAHNDYIQPESLVSERYIICAAWRWEGEKEIQTVSVLDDPKRFKKNHQDDYHVTKTLRAVLAEADTIVAHNGDSFDKRYVDTRILVHGFDPLPPVNSVDTYKVAKSKFYLNSNKLDYIGKLLGVGQKSKTSHGLWLRVLQGDADAVREMEKYNKQDVVLLENVYSKLRPYINTQLSREFFGEEGCPRCGSQKIQSRGTHKAITKEYHRWQCQDCGGWFRTLRGDTGTTTKYRVL
jgi:DNA polymerase elongation subunit (family B)